MDATELMKAILRKNGGIIVWQVGVKLKDESIRLSVIIPPKTVGGTHESMRHMDNTLNKALAEVFLQSHPVAKLLVLTVVDKGKPDGLFDFEDLVILGQRRIGLP